MIYLVTDRTKARASSLASDQTRSAQHNPRKQGTQMKLGNRHEIIPGILQPGPKDCLILFF